MVLNQVMYLLLTDTVETEAVEVEVVETTIKTVAVHLVKGMTEVLVIKVLVH